MTNDRRIDFYENEINLLDNFWVIARLVLEGHDVLRNEMQGLGRRTDERFDTVDFKFDALNVKVDSMADDLAEHRRMIWDPILTGLHGGFSWVNYRNR